jgi:DNA-directed RNA polymerase specialized sigma subunit
MVKCGVLFEVRTEFLNIEDLSLLGCSALMEAVRTYETSVNFNMPTRLYIPEDSKRHTLRRENLKSHI